MGLKIWNLADSNRFSDLYSVYLQTIDHLNLKLLIFVGILHVFRFDFKKLRILEILNFHPCGIVYSYYMPFCSIVKTITPRCGG